MVSSVERPDRPGDRATEHETDAERVELAEPLDRDESTATPTMPGDEPADDEGARPLAGDRSRRRPSSQIGTVAIRTAATPVGMNCSESTTPPLPPSSSSVPTIAAVRHCAALGRSQEPPPPQSSMGEEHAQHDQARGGESDAGREERRHRLDHHGDREVRRAPQDVDGQERDDDGDRRRRPPGWGGHLRIVTPAPDPVRGHNRLDDDRPRHRRCAPGRGPARRARAPDRGARAHPRRLGPGRGARAGRGRERARALGRRRHPAQPGRLADDRRASQGRRPAPAPGPLPRADGAADPRGHRVRLRRRDRRTDGGR